MFACSLINKLHYGIILNYIIDKYKNQVKN